MSVKKHYKLYKAGKQWCVAAIATVAVVAGLAGVASADDATPAVTQESTVAQTVTTDKDATTQGNSQAAQETSSTEQTAASTSDSKSADSQTTSNSTKSTDEATATTTMKLAADVNQVSLPTGRPGWSQQNGNWYYFNAQGTASTGWQQLGSWYYFDPTNGQMQSGLQPINNKYYYLNPNHNGSFGAMLTGWQQINGQWYGFGGASDGAAYTGWHYINNRWYYFEQNGHAVTDWQHINNNWYYFDPQNAWAQTGWYKSGAGRWYYFDNQNAWALKNWQKINNNWYHFDPENTWADTGWQQINNNWYYFDNQNAWALTGWQHINDNWYYFDNQNAWALKDWQYINNHWYYFDPTNVWAHKGWLQTHSGKWYYFDPTNAWALTGGWHKVNNAWYYFDQNGKAADPGWQKIDGNWYHFNDSNAWVEATGWQWINGNLAYLDKNGHPATGQDVDLNGLTLHADADGLIPNAERTIREGIAQKIATLVNQQRNNTILYDWTSQDHDYQELALHDNAQLLAQGDMDNDKTVIESLLKQNDLLNGEVVASSVINTTLDNLNVNSLTQNFVNSLPSGDLTNTVLGVGYDTTNNRFAMLLFRPGASALHDATSTISGVISDVYKNSGVTADVQNGLEKGTTLSSADLGEVLSKLSPALLKGEEGTEISQDVLKTIFAGLPGNTAAIAGTKNYYNGNDAYHYQFWLAGQNADDKLNNFLTLNKGAKYGDQLKVNYTATLVYGEEQGTATPAVNETPASLKSSTEIELAYQKGTESGSRYETVKVEPIDGMKQDTIRGVDLSSYLALVQNGVQFYDFNGQPADLLKVLSDAGVNYVRLRMWVDPYNAQGLTYGGGNDDEANVLEMARQAKKYNMKVLLALHYSDFWADPGVQLLPKQWKNLSDTDLNEELYLYTKKIANDFTKAGVTVDMAQMGNEITAGMLGIRYWGVWDNPTDSARLTGYLRSISRGFREASPSTQLAIHIETPEYNKYDSIMNTLKTNNVDYDILASSYYPFWGTGTNNPTNVAKIEKMVKDKYGKKFMIAETGWPFTLQNSDGTPNNISSVPSNLYEVSPQGQVDELADAYKAVLSNDNGLGVFYWEPSWIPAKAGWDNWEYNRLMGDVEGTGWASINSRGYYPDSKIMWEGKPASGGSSWDNNAFFDDQGHPLQSLKMYNGFLNGYESPANTTSEFRAVVTSIDNNGVQVLNPVKIGDDVDFFSVLSKSGREYLNGIAGTTISQSSLTALFHELQDGLKSATYTDAQGNQYHYEYWLDGDSASDKLANFLALNQGATYGTSLRAHYRAVLVANPSEDQLATSTVNVKLSETWGLDGVTIDDPLKANDDMPADELATVQKAVKDILTGEKGTAISAQAFQNLTNALPGVTGPLVGSKVYTMADGNQYHYEYWLTTKDVQAANQGAKYGDPINLTYSASLKWIDPNK
jgi:arabinogalactan endo-1,4-beta-galactosidase